MAIIKQSDTWIEELNQSMAGLFFMVFMYSPSKGKLLKTAALMYYSDFSYARVVFRSVSARKCSGLDEF